jgi:hypothetical protein
LTFQRPAAGNGPQARAGAAGEAATAHTHLDEDNGIAHELEPNGAVERGRAFLLIALRYSLLHHGASAGGRVSACIFGRGRDFLLRYSLLHHGAGGGGLVSAAPSDFWKVQLKPFFEDKIHRTFVYNSYK